MRESIKTNIQQFLEESGAPRKNALVDLMTFGEIDLDDIKVIVSGVALATGPVVVMLVNSKLGDEGATALACTLEQAQYPMMLGLINSNIGDAGATALACTLERAQACTLEQAQYPIMLMLRGSKIGPDGEAALERAVARASVQVDVSLNKEKLCSNKNRIEADERKSIFARTPALFQIPGPVQGIILKYAETETPSDGWQQRKQEPEPELEAAAQLGIR